MPITYRSIVNDNTFIGRYMGALETGETPYIYDFWSAMYVLSTLVGRACVVPRPQVPVYLNLYAMFVSDSGVTRKSTTINFARTILNRVDGHCHVPQVIESKETPESLEYRLVRLSRNKGNAHVTICVSELMRFLGKQAYSNAMPGLLTDLYDSPKSRTSGTVQGGQATYENVYVTFLAGTTPRWLEKAVHPDVVEGGFTSRTLFITADQRKRLDPWSLHEPPPIEPVIDELTATLRDVRDEVPLTPKAINWYRLWYRRLAKQRSTSAFIESFLSREPDHVLRCAALLSINSREYRIDVPTLKLAAKIVSDARGMGARLFAGGRYVSNRTKVVVRIAEIVLAAGRNGIKHTELITKTRHIVTSAEFRDTIAVMVESGLIGKAEVPQLHGAGRPALYYVPMDKLRSTVALEEVIDTLSGEL